MADHVCPPPPLLACPARAAGGGYNPNAGMNPLQESILKLMQGPDGQGEQGIDINDVSVASEPAGSLELC
jgi:hypothetical protein